MLSTSNSRWPTPRGSTTVRCSGLRLKDASPSGDSTRYCSSRFPSIPRPAGTLPSLIIKARVNFCFCHRLQASLWWLLLCRSSDLRGAPCGKPGTSRNPFHPLAAARQPKFARCGRLFGIDRSEQSSPGPCVICPPYAAVVATGPQIDRSERMNPFPSGPCDSISACPCLGSRGLPLSGVGPQWIHEIKFSRLVSTRLCTFAVKTWGDSMAEPRLVAEGHCSECNLRLWLEERTPGAGFVENFDAMPKCKHKQHAMRCPSFRKAMSALRAKG
jgi:hypothetical protein